MKNILLVLISSSKILLTSRDDLPQVAYSTNFQRQETPSNFIVVLCTLDYYQSESIIIV